jgi:hypothetical protein
VINRSIGKSRARNGGLSPIWVVNLPQLVLTGLHQIKSTITSTRCDLVRERSIKIWDESTENPSRKKRSKKREQTDQINPNLEGNQSKPRRGKRKRAKKRATITDAKYPMLHDRRRRDCRWPLDCNEDEAAPDWRGGGGGWNFGGGERGKAQALGFSSGGDKGVRQIKKYRRWEGNQCRGLLWTWVVINCEGLLCGHGCFWPQEICDGRPCRHVSKCPCRRVQRKSQVISYDQMCREDFVHIRMTRRASWPFIFELTDRWVGGRCSGRIGVGGRIGVHGIING